MNQIKKQTFRALKTLLFVVASAIALNLVAPEVAEAQEYQVIIEEDGTIKLIDAQGNITEVAEDGTGLPAGWRVDVEGSVISVYDREDNLVGFKSITTVKAKAEGPGVLLIPSRMKPDIEKVIAEKTYDKELKSHYLEPVFMDKAKLLTPKKMSVKELNETIEKVRE